MHDIRSRYGKCALLLTEFIENFAENDPSILGKQDDIFLDIDQLKEAKNLKEVNAESLVALCLVLLKQLQPYITDLSHIKLEKE